MTVTSSVHRTPLDHRDYPWIGVIGCTVVLFSDRNTGTVIAEEGNDYCVGEFSDSWDIDMFDEFTGAVTLANDGVEIAVLDEEAGD